MMIARTIRVTGKGVLKVRPDMMRITITLEGLYPDYADTLKHYSEDTETLKDVLSAFGFERSDLKTLNFAVDTKYESYRDNGAYKQRFVGYEYTHKIKVDFLSDNDRLGKILYALAHCSIQPEFNISFTVKDKEAAKNKLLRKAVLDAKEKAGVLSSVAGVTLKGIQTIDYSWGEIDFEMKPMNRALLTDDYLSQSTPYAASYDLNIEPDDIEVSDTVTVVWEIE